MRRWSWLMLGSAGVATLLFLVVSNRTDRVPPSAPVDDTHLEAAVQQPVRPADAPPRLPASAAPADRAAALPPSFEPSGEPSLGFFRDSIETALREQMPRLKLSESDVDRLARAARRLRASQEALRRLPPTAEHAERRRALTEAVSQAGAVFHELTGLSPGEFTAAAAPGEGIDQFDPSEPVPEGEFLEPRP